MVRPIEHIRRNVFQLSQAAFAEIAGVTQPTVSRWEAGEWEPNRDDLERIRQAALGSGKPWSDAWFFEAPAVEIAS
jgi:transcriptional regulator with XRE-family HTH domain